MEVNQPPHLWKSTSALVRLAALFSVVPRVTPRRYFVPPPFCGQSLLRPTDRPATHSVLVVGCRHGDRKPGGDAARPLSRPRAAAPRRQHPVLHGRRIGTPDLVALRGRPDGRAPRGTPSLRLRERGRPCERPPDLLQGPRLAARLRHVPCGRRDHRRGAPPLPQARQPSRGPSDAAPAVGRRRNGLLGPRPPERRRDRPRRQATTRG